MTQECSTGKKWGYAITAVLLFIVLIPKVLLNVDGKVFDGDFGKVISIGKITEEKPSAIAFFLHLVVFGLLIWGLTWVFEYFGEECDMGKDVDDETEAVSDNWLKLWKMIGYAAVGYFLVFLGLHMKLGNNDQKKFFITRSKTLAGYPTQ